MHAKIPPGTSVTVKDGIEKTGTVLRHTYATLGYLVYVVEFRDDRTGAKYREAWSARDVTVND